MTETSISQPKALAPRRLDTQESLQTLNHWRAVFRNYYRRCQYYRLFLLPNTSWNNTENRGFTRPETTGLKRNEATLAADLDGFLDCIASFLPFDYVGEKLKSDSTNIDSVWSIIYELYDAEVNTTNFLDYANMKRESDETYRSYFNRLVGFVRQHLPREPTVSEGVSVPQGGEKLTVGLLDTIAIHWLMNIDNRLIGIVKTEFASELKTKRLSQMVKTISKNIDDLLVRYNHTDQVATINNSKQYKPQTNSVASQDSALDLLVQRVEKLEYSNNKNRRKKQFWPKQQQKSQCNH